MNWMSRRALIALLSVVSLTSAASAAVTERSVYYTYDTMGRRLSTKLDSATGADGIVNAYNGFGDLTLTTVTMSGFSKALQSTYDSGGRRSQLVHPENTSGYTFSYCYDNLSRLTTVGQGTTCTTAPLDNFTYANNGLVSNRGEGSASASTTAYTWDDIGRLLSQTDAFFGSTGNVGRTFSYNLASQIVSDARNTSAYSWTPPGASSRAYAVNGLNQYTTAGSTGFSYDANGNLISDGTNTYTYDVENRLVSATAGAVATTLTYDPSGRLFEAIKKTSGVTNSDTRFVYDGDALVLEYDANGTVTNRYVHGTNAAADDPLVWYAGSTLTTAHFLHADHEGSIVAVTDGTGAKYAINTYDEYGNPVFSGSQSTNTGRFQYTGQAWLNELNLYYYKARFYSPGLGRFLQTDPIGYSGGINLYAYAGDDPKDSVDPLGTACVTLVNDDSEFCERAELYQRWAGVKLIGGRTDFFAAAAGVSRALADVDLPGSGLAVGGAAYNFLQNTGRGLEIANREHVDALVSGRIYAGWGRLAIDRAWVRFEQDQVEKQLDQLSASERKGVVSNINSLFNLPNPVPGADSDFRQALGDTHRQLGRPIDFGRESDRVRLGDNMNDIARSKAICTGSRIPGAGDCGN
jgi:RHS repeat-associated protein